MNFSEFNWSFRGILTCWIRKIIMFWIIKSNLSLHIPLCLFDILISYSNIISIRVACRITTIVRFILLLIVSLDHINLNLVIIHHTCCFLSKSKVISFISFGCFSTTPRFFVLLSRSSNSLLFLNRKHLLKEYI